MTAFDLGLRGQHCWLDLGDGSRVMLPVTRWHATADDADGVLLDACHGPAIDLGCGPGRLTAALAGRGIPALGVDLSPVAVRLTRARGVPALRRNVFEPLPGEGRWRHALLADGNVGIGGDPVAMLRRAGELVRPGGTVLVEVESPGRGAGRQRARVSAAEQRGEWFDWAWLGADAVELAADVAGLRCAWLTERSGRWFAELVRPTDHAGVAQP
ncbi:methyltransferase domain-containing protein [Solihabitans fulvus]|uniref:Methyltransferase domain-containing protein n=1 Tax=Solihabitans fulvus TaxID=1892852 RepID=A0A5B2WNQ7_9PSEU|nr:methyltransferase domain-containing protein [Solihabitans fulvus]KAA2252116.1 methyltransferase domain-containing protein [Solihabitans fulvus]